MTVELCFDLNLTKNPFSSQTLSVCLGPLGGMEHAIQARNVLQKGQCNIFYEPI